jgi:hypothetical protein
MEGARRPELKAWFKALKSKAGAACCDDGEAEHAEAVGHGERRLQGFSEKPDQPGRTRPMFSHRPLLLLFGFGAFSLVALHDWAVSDD